jgi:lipoprotein-anchoring transpeptidase ErfK/SrfK
MRRGVAAALAVGSVLVVGAVPALAQDPATEPPATLPANVIAPGVKIAGVDVGGLTRAAARVEVVRAHVAPRLKPVVVVHRGKRIPLRPASLGYTADVDYALTGALLFGRSRPVPANGVNVPLRQSVDATRIERVLTARVARFDVAPRNAAFSLRGATPVVREARPGVELNVPRSARILSAGLVKRTRSTFTLPARRSRADVTTLPTAIIIDRGNFRLTLWKHRGKSQVYPIAVGTSSHPTPVGNFRVIQKQVNPTWFPPSSPWAAGLGPVPPGPSNPLGTRWIGTSAPAIGMHGTPVPSSIGTRASHGCIRMYMRDVERLYSQVSIGTPVYIR